MNVIFYNGRVHTLNHAQTICSAVAVQNGLIAAVGSDDALRPLAGPKTETVDLKGAAMFPGFMEAHNHLAIYGYLLKGLDLSASKVGKMADILSLVKARAEEQPAGSWIKGSRYAEYFLAENRHPTRKELDEVSPNHPVVLFHTSFHACVANTLGLKAFDIGRDTPSPQGGIIEKDPDTGEPTGVLHDQAMMDPFNRLFFTDLSDMGPKGRRDLCAGATQAFADLGLVFGADALTVPLTLQMYQETLAAGHLRIRIYTMNYEILADPLVQAQIKTGFGSGRLRIGPIKLFADGGMSNRTAAVSEPFLTPPHGKGLKIHSREALMEKIKRYDALGYQIAVHAQGDEGIGDTLDAFEAVLGARSENPLRHRIEHAGCLYPPLLERAANMHIMASVQPVFLSELGDGFLEAFGPERTHQLYPFKSMLEAGMRLGGSSDCPVSQVDPRIGLRDAVLRRAPSGEVLGGREALTMDQALRLYCQGSPCLSFDEGLNGTIEHGKRADFTVMAADPRDINPEEVPAIPFTMTVVGGEIVSSDC